MKTRLSFSILSVFMRVNYQYKQKGRTTLEFICPKCGKKASGDSAINAWHCFHCDAGGGVLDFIMALSLAEDKASACKWYAGEVEASPVIPKAAPVAPPKPELPLASIEDCSHVYEQFLKEISLVERHRRNLLKRGVLPETIEKNLYRSFPGIGLRTIPDNIRASGLRTDGVPGFLENGSLKAMPSGFLIPCRGIKGEITGFQIRLDDPEWLLSLRLAFHTTQRKGDASYLATKKVAEWLKVPEGTEVFSASKDPHGLLEKAETESLNRYIWLSGDGYADTDKKIVRGPRISGSRCIHHRGISNETRSVAVTEGPLKADIFYQQCGFPIIALPGATRFRDFEQWGKAMANVEKYYFFFDMDQFTNPNVGAAVKRMKEIAEAAGKQVVVKTWDPKYKGIDDFLVSPDWHK